MSVDIALHYALRERRLIVPLSAYISSLSLALLLNYAHDSWLLFLPVFLTIGSKYLSPTRAPTSSTPRCAASRCRCSWAGT